MLFQTPHKELTDEEIAEVLRQMIVSAGRLPREAGLIVVGSDPVAAAPVTRSKRTDRMRPFPQG